MTSKVRVLAVLAMLGWVGCAQAQYYPTVRTVGNVSNGWVAVFTDNSGRFIR